MPPATSRDFLKVAGQRLAAAEALAENDFTLDAQYLGGYTVECALKALILHRTPEPDHALTLNWITKGASMHETERLREILRGLGIELPADLAVRLRRFVWTTGLRYETGRRDKGETTGFLKTARAVRDWAEEHLP